MRPGRPRGGRATRQEVLPACGGSGDRYPEEVLVIVIVIVSGMLGGGRLRRIGQAEQAGRMRALVHLAQLADRDVGVNFMCSST